jgi:hypothetical protein
MRIIPSKQLLSLPEADRIQWAEWLESGKYTQNIGSWCMRIQYEDGGEFHGSCCMHVYAMEKDNKGKWTDRPSDIYPNVNEDDDEDSWLNNIYMGSVQLGEMIAVTIIADEEEEIVGGYRLERLNETSYHTGFEYLNDSLKLDFHRIAKLIRGKTLIFDQDKDGQHP